MTLQATAKVARVTAKWCQFNGGNDMETHPADLEHLTARRDKLERQVRWGKRAGAVLLISTAAVLLITSRSRPDTGTPGIPGWVIALECRAIC